MPVVSPPLLPLKHSESDNFQLLHFLTPFWPPKMCLGCNILFSTTLARSPGWPGHDCSSVCLLPPWHSGTPPRWLITLLLKSPDSGIPQNCSSSCFFIGFWLLRASPKPVGASPGPSGFGINVFTICRSTPCSSFENSALVSSDFNTTSYTHHWCSFQAHPDWCFCLFLLHHLSIRKCFANSAQLTVSFLLNPSSNALSPACSQCKQSNAWLFALASQEVMSRCDIT